MKNWKCAVCNHINTGDAPPDICPVCGADKSFFAEVSAQQIQNVRTEKEQNITSEPSAETSQAPSERRWKCTICGYIHIGDEPPDTCPTCAADKSFFIEITTTEQPEEKTEEKVEVAPQSAIEQDEPVGSENHKTERFGWIGKFIVRLHLHPISVHTPNGVIPIALVFLVLAIAFGYEPLEKASFFNLIVVFLMMPAVLFTGFIVWQKKYGGVLTIIFKIKMVSAAIVAVLTSLLVFWRIIDPEIAFSGSTSSLIYIGIYGINLVAAGIAGHLGGKLALR